MKINNSTQVYYNKDKTGRLSSVEYDYDNDGKIDKAKSFKYDKNGSMTGIFTDSDNDGRPDIYEEYGKDGKIKSKRYYEYDDKNKTKTTSADKNNDGKIDSVGIFQYDKDGKCENAQYDYNNDGKFDEKFIYDREGKKASKYKDTDSDGKYDQCDQYDKNGKVRSSQNFKNHTRTVYDDKNGDGKYDSVSYYQDDKNGNCQSAKFDNNNDGKIDSAQRFTYDKQGNMTGRYIDNNNDGKDDKYEKFSGSGDIKSLLDVASREVGQAETTANNDGSAVSKYGKGDSGYPWCANFASWCLEEGLGENNTIKRDSFCDDIVDQAKNQNVWAGQGDNYSPQSGDLIFFDWDRNGKANHVGIVERVQNGKVYTIEGNSSDSVRRQEYSLDSEDIFGYYQTQKAQDK